MKKSILTLSVFAVIALTTTTIAVAESYKESDKVKDKVSKNLASDDLGISNDFQENKCGEGKTEEKESKEKSKESKEKEKNSEKKEEKTKEEKCGEGKCGEGK